MSVQTVMNLIVKHVHELLSVPVVPTNNIGKKPDYPFLSYKVTTARSQTNGYNLKTELGASSDENFEYDIKETIIEMPTFTVSFSAYDSDAFNAASLAESALTAIQHTLCYELEEINAVVVGVTDVSDRTILIVDNYESRYGFDVMIRITTESSRTIETMEEININGGINE